MDLVEVLDGFCLRFFGGSDLWGFLSLRTMKKR